MQLPSLPTDDLYKFLTITGVLLFIVSYVYPEAMIYTAGARLNEVQTQIDLLELEQGRLEAVRANRNESVEAKMKLLAADEAILGAPASHNPHDISNIRERVGKLYEKEIEERVAWIDADYAVRRRIAEIGGATRQLNLEIERVAKFEQAGRVGKIASFMFFAVGIVGWSARERFRVRHRRGPPSLS